MSHISWKNDALFGCFGYVDEMKINLFTIYGPGDPCNSANKDKFELIWYTTDTTIKRSYHTNLEAAKRAARRIYRKLYPVNKLLTWDTGKDVSFGKNSDGTAWFIANEFKGSGKRFVAETAESGYHTKVFNTMNQAKAYCEMMEKRMMEKRMM